jgi:putative spermidine/putrescine transport system permease protein
MKATGIATLGLILLFLLGPFIVILLAGLSAGETLVFPPQGLSLRWLAHVLTSDALASAFWLSMALACASTAAALLLGVPAAYGLVRYPVPGREAIRAIVTSPAIVPGLIVGLALLRYFVVPLNLPVVAALFVSHTALIVPYAVRVVSASLDNLGTDIEEAAVVLGLDRFAAFRAVVLPNIRSGILAAAVLGFVTSFNQLPVSLFLTGPGITPLPIEMLTEMEYTYDPSIAALSAVLALGSVAVVLIAERLLGLSRHL